jgi:hypothetical protein
MDVERDGIVEDFDSDVEDFDSDVEESKSSEYDEEKEIDREVEEVLAIEEEDDSLETNPGSSDGGDPEDDELELPDNEGDTDEDDDEESSSEDEEKKATEAVLFGDPERPEKSQTDDLPEEEKPGVIVLKKGASLPEIWHHIHKIDYVLEHSPKMSGITVTTNGWDSDARPYQTVRGAIQLFRDYIEAGLIGCLLSHNVKGNREAAREIYCVGYVKGKKVGNVIKYANVNTKEMFAVMEGSIKAYIALQKKWKKEEKS